MSRALPRTSWARRIRSTSMFDSRIHLVLLMACVVTVGMSPVPAGSATDPILVGVLVPMTGPLAQIGPATKDGIEFYFREQGYKVAGRPVKLVVEDDRGEPGEGLTKARKLVERDKAHVLTGIVHSGVAMALRDYVHTQAVPMVITVAGVPALTQEAKSPHVFRVVRAFGQGDAVGGWYAVQELRWKKIVMIYLNYAAGQTAAEGFKRTFIPAGGQMVEELKPPLGTPDFGPYLSRIAARAGEIDGLWAYIVAADAIRFAKQYEEFGLKQRIKLFANADMFIETNLPAMGRTAVGHLAYSDNDIHAGLGRGTPETLQFVEAFRAAYGRPAGVLEFSGYVGAQAIAEALKQVSGNVENREAFEAALRRIRFRSPSGRTFAFDANQNAVVNVAIVRMVERQGIAAHEVITVIPDVDQFWKPR